MRKILTFWLVFVLNFCFGQTQNLEETFSSPLKIPLVLAGTFGELRTNHFHSGLDIKTQGRQGLEVFAVDSGFIKRIRIQRYSYGKALYIEHANGYTSVYAHLKKFAPKIEAYVKAKQYENESYIIELFPGQDELKLEKGELIAYSGNTGGSLGPHLHFEIRDSFSRPMNPFLFGIKVKDTRAPLITALKAYPLSDSSQINQSQLPTELRFTQQADGSFLSENITVYGTIGFGIGAVDQQDAASNSNGIYKIESIFNGHPVFELKMDKFSFAETRYINRLIDYEHFEIHKRRIRKLFIEQNNPLSIYTQAVDNGILQLTEEGNTFIYHINVYDYAGNRSAVSIPITINRDSIIQPKQVEQTDFFAPANDHTNFQLGEFEIYIPKGAFYDNHYLDIKLEDNILQLHNDIYPVHKNISLKYDISSYAEADRAFLYLASLNYKDDLYYLNTSILHNKLSAWTNSLGRFTVGIDKTPPTITSSSLADGKWMSKYNKLQLKITDEDSGIKNYRATINGKFILMEYEHKTDLLTYDFADGIVTDTENLFKLIVTDNVGNSTTFTATFYRK